MKQRKNIKEKVIIQGNFTQKQQTKMQKLLSRIQTMRLRMQQLGYHKQDVETALFKALQGQCQNQQHVNKSNIHKVLKRIFTNCKDMDEFIDNLVIRFETHMSQLNQKLPPESQSQQQVNRSPQCKQKQQSKIEIYEVKKQLGSERMMLDDLQDQFLSLNPKRMKRKQFLKMLIQHRQKRRMQKMLHSKNIFSFQGRIFDFDS